jgi:hypothetical protein
MAKLVPITREQFGGKRWVRHDNYRFASHDPIVPLAASELARAALAMPLAFLQLEGRYTLVAVQSLLPQRNMFVTADGRWLGLYVPAFYRGYPFRLLRKPDSEELVLCVDEESGLIVDGTSPGEEFFDKDGNASPARCSISCCSLSAGVRLWSSLLQPWPMLGSFSRGRSSSVQTKTPSRSPACTPSMNLRSLRYRTKPS